MRYKAFPAIAKKSAELIIFLIFMVLNLLPVFWGVLTSIKPTKIIAAYPPKVLGFEASLEHYRQIFHSGFLQNIGISIFYAVCSIIIGLLLGYFAAYGFHRTKFRGKTFLFYLVIAGIPLSVGSSALLIPNYLYFLSMGLNNHWYTLILIYTAYNLPMAIWVIRGGIEAVPLEIEEAAAIDGCSRAYTVGLMVPRFILPSLAAAALFFFIGAWNEFIVSSVMVDNTSLRPVQLAIYYYLGFFGQEWGPLTASATTAIIPILLVFTIVGRFMISGLTTGSVKE